VSAPETAPRKVILDCDPGIDDAFAIAFGCGHPAIELCGVTTVAGNVGLGRTTGNALAVLEFLGRGDVPVAAGCPAPLLRPFTEAHDVHGETGLGAASLPAAQARPVAAHAVDFLIERIGAEPGTVTLVATGPLTNVALAVRRHRRWPARSRTSSSWAARRAGGTSPRRPSSTSGATPRPRRSCSPRGGG
jgi:purine nucleosidase